MVRIEKRTFAIIGAIFSFVGIASAHEYSGNMCWWIADNFYVEELNSGVWYCKLCGGTVVTYGDLSYLLLLISLIILIGAIVLVYKVRKK